jgi:hypothetical protein
MRNLLPIVPLLLSSQLGCDHNPCETGRCEPMVSIAYSVDFGVTDDSGFTPGFNLDGMVSQERDARTCGHGDAIAPDGSEGIDNNAAVLFESVEQLTAANPEEIIRSSINDGRLLLMTRLWGVDDPENDECVDVELFQAEGLPQVGNDGYILKNQTFDRKDGSFRTLIECASIVDGMLEAGPFNGDLAVSVFAINVELKLRRARLRGEMSPNGLGHIMLGAGVNTDELHDALVQGNDPTIEESGHFLIDRLADMAPDKHGRCQQLSATLLLDFQKAFLFSGSADGE